MTDIPLYNTFSKIEPLTKGWSKDKKLYIETDSGDRLLLRISDIAELERKKAEYEKITQLYKMGLAVSKPVAFGTCDDGINVYMLLGWLDGEEASEILPSLSEETQYNLGVKAGQYLKKIHSIPAPESLESWESRYTRKLIKTLKLSESCEIKTEGYDRFLKYIETNRFLLKGRPQCFQHGDYHAGNMIISPVGELGIIDFNRIDYGDPWEEFNRITWCSKYSGFFASGRLNGCFGGRPPAEFFRLLALYIARDMLAAVPWAIPFGQKEVDIMRAQALFALDFYDGMQNPVPKWYIEA